ncbi:MAG: hypothetical protein Q7T16_04205 [Candidatus Burarchaeum sp.]|nr:hypothetical protein [Candidatus Burarchaeum sp.]MDO8339833.1 hypothetical protein [Candidatus Burarchaeum sp.]
MAEKEPAEGGKSKSSDAGLWVIGLIVVASLLHSAYSIVRGPVSSLVNDILSASFRDEKKWSSAEEYSVSAEGTPQQRLLNVVESLTAQNNGLFNKVCEMEAGEKYLLRLQEDVRAEGTEYHLCSTVSAGPAGEVLLEQEPMSKMQGAENYVWIQRDHTYISTKTASLRAGFYDVVGVAGDKLIVGHGIMVPQDGLQAEPAKNLTVNMFANMDEEGLSRVKETVPLLQIWEMMVDYLGVQSFCISIARDKIDEVRLQPNAGENGEAYLYIKEKGAGRVLGEQAGQTVLVFRRNQLDLAEKVHELVQDFANSNATEPAEAIGKLFEPAREAATLGGSHPGYAADLRRANFGLGAREKQKLARQQPNQPANYNRRMMA